MLYVQKYEKEKSKTKENSHLSASLTIKEIYHIENKLSNFCFFDMDLLCIYNHEVFFRSFWEMQ